MRRGDPHARINTHTLSGGEKRDEYEARRRYGYRKQSEVKQRKTKQIK